MSSNFELLKRFVYNTGVFILIIKISRDWQTALGYVNSQFVIHNMTNKNSYTKH